MTSLTEVQVVRRSALEAAHLALGARWVAEHVHWPEGYGADDAAASMVAVAGGAGLAEIGPLWRLSLRSSWVSSSLNFWFVTRPPLRAFRRPVSSLYPPKGDNGIAHFRKMPHGLSPSLACVVHHPSEQTAWCE